MALEIAPANALQMRDPAASHHGRSDTRHSAGIDKALHDRGYAIEPLGRQANRFRGSA